MGHTSGSATGNFAFDLEHQARHPPPHALLPLLAWKRFPDHVPHDLTGAERPVNGIDEHVVREVTLRVRPGRDQQAEASEIRVLDRNTRLLRRRGPEAVPEEALEGFAFLRLHIEADDPHGLPWQRSPCQLCSGGRLRTHLRVATGRQGLLRSRRLSGVYAENEREQEPSHRT